MHYKTIIYEFIKQHHLAAMGTVNQQALPEVSVIGYVFKQIGEDFEIHVATYDSSRKYANLKRNPRVALAIGWESGKTVQIEGEAVKISDAEEIKELVWSDLGKMPTVAKYIKPERVVFFKIKPTWLRYSDFSTEPWDRHELRFI
jgi:general stress protein 26